MSRKKKAKVVKATGTELLVLDDNVLDLLSRTIEKRALELSDQIKEINDRISTDTEAANKALNRLAFEFPDLAEELRRVLNRIAYLSKAPPVADNVDPHNERDEDDNLQKDLAEAKRLEEEEEAEDIRRMRQTADGIVLEKTCKRLFRRISALCHPDRTKDVSLHPIFDYAKKAFLDLDMTFLESILGDVTRYLKVRKNNATFQQYMADIIRKKQRDLEIVKHRLHAHQQTTTYKTLIASRSQVKAVRRAGYAELIKEQCAQAMRTLKRIEKEQSLHSPFK